MKIKEFWDSFIMGKDSSQETEFLPAILEVTETPASPIGRLLMWSLISLIVVVFTWSCFGHINEVAIAPGKVIPTGQIKTVQIKNKSIVKEIHVKEGQHVKKDDILVVMDPTSTDAESDNINRKVSYFSVDIQRLEAELSGMPFSPKKDIYLEISDLTAEKALYQSRVNQYRSEMDAARLTVQQKAAALEAERTNYDKLSELLEISKKKEDRLAKLFKENAVAEFQLLEQTFQRVNYEKSAIAQLETIRKAEAEFAEAKSKLANIDASYKKDIMSTLVESRKQYYTYLEEAKKADENRRLSRVVAPISGNVYNLAINTEGGIVTDAQPLLIIVPDNVELELEVWVDNKDIGFIKKGQEAEVKVSTFNFQKFGMIKAVVKEISADADNDKNNPEHYKKFKLLLQMQDNTLDISGVRTPITPGMDVTAEIKIREKRIIEFFLDPFKRYTHEALRER